MITQSPQAGFVIARSGCRTMHELERHQMLHGSESGIILRLPNGGYADLHRPPAAPAQPGAPTPTEAAAP